MADLDYNNQANEQLDDSLRKSKGAGQKTAQFAKKLKDEEYRKKIIANAKKAKELAIKTAKLIYRIIAAFISTFGVVPLLLTLLIVVMLSIIPTNIWYSNQTDTTSKTSLHNKTSTILKTAYQNEQQTITSNIVDYLRSYGCTVDSTILMISRDSYDMSSENNDTICNMKVNFTPSSETVVNEFNGYASGVNGALEYLSDVIADSESELNENLTNDLYDYTFNKTEEEKEAERERVAKDVKENGNEYESVDSQKFINSLSLRSGNIFFVDESPSQWTISVNTEKDKIVGYQQKSVCKEYETKKCSVLSTSSATYQANCQSKKDTYRVCSKTVQEDDLSKPIKKDQHDISITINMGYDVSNYKKSELDEAIKEFAVYYGANEDEARVQINQLITSYKSSFNEYYGIQIDDDGNYVPGAAVGGTNAIFFQQGEQGYEGHFTINDYRNRKDFDYENLISGNGSLIWNRIESNSAICTSYYFANPGIQKQCVTFVKGWLYDAYGSEYATSLGNGQDVVATLVNSFGWTLLDTPAPGAVFSASATASNPYGHVGIILAVENGTVTYMDGNVGGTGRIRKATVSYENFMNGKMGSAYIKFAVKK